MADQTVIKYDINGPAAGLSKWDDIPEQDVQSGSPVQTGHVYFSTDSGRYYSGVWDCTTHQLVQCPYGVDEFMIVLEGSIIIEDATGNSETFSTGESFIVPKGFDCSWKQTEYTRKFFVIHDNPASTEEPDPDNGCIRVDSSTELDTVASQDESLYLSNVPEMNLLSLFRDPNGEFEVGLWDCSPMKRIPATLARSELMHILEGSGSITNADGVVFNFEAGDTFMVPIGMGYQWQNHSYVKKIFCAYTPK